MQSPLAAQYCPTGQLVASHGAAHIVPSAQAPVGQRTGAGRTQLPAASQLPAPVTRPAAQLAMPQSSPIMRGDQSIALRSGSQTRHG